MFPSLDPQKMQQMMKKLGVKMDNIPAKQVVIKTDTGSNITIDEPQVIKTTMSGQVIFQISGNVKEQSFSDEDIKLVIEQSGIKDEEKVKKALQETNGDIVEAIIKLKGS
jgi:nascent polypeptide-associated complex subunit alpha